MILRVPAAEATNRLEGFSDIKEGDLLEAFRIEQVKRTLD